MKRYNYYFTLILVIFMTVFAFFKMFTIVDLSKQVITIVYTNLLPSLLPFMILTSLCLNLGLLDILGFIIQKPFYSLFHLTPMMSSLYFISFFCGYPTNVKLIKEAYLLHYININELQHLLHICSFASLSFIFVSLKNKYSLIIYLSHILPSLLFALFYRHPKQTLSLHHALKTIKEPHLNFVLSFKKSIISSIYAFIFILGYMLVFQFLSYFLGSFIHSTLTIELLQGLMEFSSGCLRLVHQPLNPFLISCICFFLSFSSLSVMMQCDNLLEDIPYNHQSYFKFRLLHGICSFLICYGILVIS